jgi:hypothetical protein
MYALSYPTERWIYPALSAQRTPRAPFPSSMRANLLLLFLTHRAALMLRRLSSARRLLLLQTYLAVPEASYVLRGSHHEPPIVDYAARDAQHFASARAGGAYAQKRMVAHHPECGSVPDRTRAEDCASALRLCWAPVYRHVMVHSSEAIATAEEEVAGSSA